MSLGSPQFTTLDCGAFLVTDAFFPPSHRLEKHFHDRTVVGVTVKGEWDSVLGATRLANQAGILHVEPAGDSHVNQFGANGAHVIVLQPNPLEDTLHPFRALLESASQVRVGAMGMILADRLQHELLDPDDLTSLAIEGLSIDLLISASRSQRHKSGPATPWLVRTVNYMHESFLQRPTLAELSSLAGVSADHLNREFRRRYYMSAAEYLRRLRLEWAAERLRGRHASLADIACAAGFADQSHFTRRFRQQFGITPATYRSAFYPS